MKLVKIKPFENGAHDNCGYSHAVAVSDGWAVISPEVGTPKTLENFPFGNFEVEEIDGVLYMKKDSWTPLPMPEPAPEPEDDPSVWDELDAAYQEGVNSAYDQ